MKAFSSFSHLTITLVSCHSSKVTIQKLDRYPMESTLYAEIKMEKKDLINLLNQQIDSTLQEPISKGNIAMEVSRTDNMSMSIKDDKLLYSLPIHLKASMGSFAKATGNLTLWFESQ